MESFSAVENKTVTLLKTRWNRGRRGRRGGKIKVFLVNIYYLHYLPSFSTHLHSSSFIIILYHTPSFFINHPHYLSLTLIYITHYHSPSVTIILPLIIILYHLPPFCITHHYSLLLTISSLPFSTFLHHSLTKSLYT